MLVRLLVLLFAVTTDWSLYACEFGLSICQVSFFFCRY